MPSPRYNLPSPAASQLDVAQGAATDLSSVLVARCCGKQTPCATAGVLPPSLMMHVGLTCAGGGAGCQAAQCGADRANRQGSTAAAWRGDAGACTAVRCQRCRHTAQRRRHRRLGRQSVPLPVVGSHPFCGRLCEPAGMHASASTSPMDDGNRSRTATGCTLHGQALCSRSNQQGVLISGRHHQALHRQAASSRCCLLYCGVGTWGR